MHTGAAHCLWSAEVPAEPSLPDGPQGAVGARMAAPMLSVTNRVPHLWPP